MTAELVIRFERKEIITVTPFKYYFHVKVDEPLSTPDEIEPCLVFTSGSEQIARVASLAEMTSIEETAAVLTTFYAPSLSSTLPEVGDEIDIRVVPTLWNEIGYALGAYTIVSEDIAGSNTVVVAGEFPAFATGISFGLITSGGSTKTTYTDGEARRTYAGSPDIEYRTKEHYDLFDTLDAAQNMLTSLRGQAQGLVDAWNEDTYTGDDTEVFV